MMPISKAPRSSRLAGTTAAVAFAASLMVSGFISAARADTLVSEQAVTVRNAIVAMSLADAAMPVAMAVAMTRDERPAIVPLSSAALKPETSAAMASMKTASARNAGSYNTASYDRRVRPYRDPFLLILGVAY